MVRTLFAVCLLLFAAFPASAQQRPQRYWPVVTNEPRAMVVSSPGNCIALRCFAAPRPVSRLANPLRHHVGLDLYARPGDRVLAIADGRIVAFFPFLVARTGERTWALMIDHGDRVVLYGEVRADAMANRRIGDSVRAGQEIARISDTAQLHVETYPPGTRRNARWPFETPQPAGVSDPTAFVTDLAANATRVRP